MQTILNRVLSGEVRLKDLPVQQLDPLCAEIRDFLIRHVAKTGGHLSSNLGTVELTVALHRVFNTPIDAFVFDVGHQCYTHKILTGRADRFRSSLSARPPGATRTAPANTSRPYPAPSAPQTPDAAACPRT